MQRDLENGLLVLPLEADSRAAFYSVPLVTALGMLTRRDRVGCALDGLSM